MQLSIHLLQPRQDLGKQLLYHRGGLTLWIEVALILVVADLILSSTIGHTETAYELAYKFLEGSRRI